MTGDTLRSAIDKATDLVDPRLSEVDWERVAAMLDDAKRIAELAERIQYVNPNGREDAWNQGVKALAARLSESSR